MTPMLARTRRHHTIVTPSHCHSIYISSSPADQPILSNTSTLARTASAHPATTLWRTGKLEADAQWIEYRAHVAPLRFAPCVVSSPIFHAYQRPPSPSCHSHDYRRPWPPLRLFLFLVVPADRRLQDFETSRLHSRIDAGSLIHHFLTFAPSPRSATFTFPPLAV
jgi:hypothetical protein